MAARCIGKPAGHPPADVVRHCRAGDPIVSAYPAGDALSITSRYELSMQQEGSASHM